MENENRIATLLDLPIEIWNEFSDEQKTIIIDIAFISLAFGLFNYIIKESEKIKK